MPNRKGDDRERELVRMFEEAGGVATRSAGSGGGTPNPRPDIVAGIGRERFVFEVKASADDVVYISGYEFEQLCWFGMEIDAYCRLAIRFDYEDWYFIHPGDLYVTDGGNYRAQRTSIQQYGQLFKDIIKEPCLASL